MRSFGALPTPLLGLLTTFLIPSAIADEHSSNLKIEITTAASCSRPSRSGDKISVHYRGTLESTGQEFDASYNRGVPFKVTLGAGQVIQGWEEGLLDMCPGESRRLTIPPEMAYGHFGAPPAIPGDATLVFDTKLMDIIGVKQKSLSVASTSRTATSGEEMFSIATAPSTPPTEDEKQDIDDSTPTLEGTPLSSGTANTTQEGECHLLGPFALFVQGALGIVAVLSLVYKRRREENRRPWMIWFFDVSKQVFGAMLIHVLNLFMSMLGSGELTKPAQKAASSAEEAVGPRHRPNPCSFYLLNLGIDTTLGIPILYLMLKILHVAFYYTPLARPPQSIKSGNYGQPPQVTWFLKQSLIYFIGLTGMKLFVLCLFALLPWLPWVGDWALRWTEGNEAVQIAFTMFIFPLLMNGLQYWIIDSLIMDKSRGKEDGYRQVQGDDNDDEDGDLGDDETITVEESVRGKGSDDMVPPLKEVNPTPVPNYDDGVERGEGSRTPSPQDEEMGRDGTRSR